MDQAAQKRAGRQHHGAGRNDAAVSQADASDALLDVEIVHFCFDHVQIRGVADRLLHRRRIKLAVGLGARAAHCGPLAAIEDPELDATGIGDAAHEAVERIDLAHQVALAEPADGRIAGHGADGGEAMGDQGRARAHAGGCSRRLTAGVAASDNDHVEAGVHPKILQDAGLVANAGLTVKTRPYVAPWAMFHVKHALAERSDVVVNDSFTNAKIAKDNVQYIFDIDSASESAQRRRG